MLTNLKTGIIYRNPHPHLKSIHAYFPSVAVPGNGDLLATIVFGEAFEAVNLHTYIARSHDNGETWALDGQLFQKPDGRITSDFARIAVLPDGELIALVLQTDRTHHKEQGLANPDTLGFVPTEFLTVRSTDFGHTWSKPEKIDSPLGNTPLELCSPVTPLRDGRYFIPTSTWSFWNGNNHNGYRMIALVSHNNCRTWPEYIDVMIDPEQERFYWESKIIELHDGRLLAVAWVYNHVKGCDLPNHYVLSENGGRSWSEPQSTGLMGQTLTPHLLDDGRILNVYRRIDRPGLWACISKLEDHRWINEEQTPLWGHQSSDLTGTGDNMADNFNVLKFGAPCITGLRDGSIFIAFWCYEDCVSGIRWFRFAVKRKKK